MCGRYFVDIDVEGIKEIFEEIERRYPGIIMNSGEIYPESTVPVITSDGPEPAFWGFPKWDGKGKIINARAESVDQKKTFKKPFERQRCIVPTTGFYEWTKDKTKIKYLFELPDEELLYLAGVYEYYENELCMVILTHDANESVKPVHNRMPVILTGDQLTLWLNETDEAKQIIEMNSPKLRKFKQDDKKQLTFDIEDK